MSRSRSKSRSGSRSRTKSAAGVGDAAEKENVGKFSYDLGNGAYPTVIEIEPFIAIVWSAVRMVVTTFRPGSIISSTNDKTMTKQGSRSNVIGDRV